MIRMRSLHPVPSQRACVAVAVVLLLAACAPTKFETSADIPQPLIEKIPIVVGVHMPLEFTEKVYEEKRPAGGGEYSIGLGKAQSAGFMRVLNAMFARVVPVASPAAAAATDAEIRGVLEPVLEDFAFVTPGDSGTQMYAASLRYTIRLYSPQGELADSWTFTGYGRSLPAVFRARAMPRWRRHCASRCATPEPSSRPSSTSRRWYAACCRRRSPRRRAQSSCRRRRPDREALHWSASDTSLTRPTRDRSPSLERQTRALGTVPDRTLATCQPATLPERSIRCLSQSACLPFQAR